MRITSRTNPQIKALRALHLRKHREQQKRYLIEGIRIVEEALACGAPVERIIYAPELLVSDHARELLDRYADIPRLEVSAEVFASLSRREGPQGLAAAVRIEETPLEAIPLCEDMLVLVVCQIRLPGNLGTIIRTADAAGITGVVVVEPSADLYDPEAVQATMGSLYALPIVRLPDEKALLEWLAKLKATPLAPRILATSAHGDRLLYEIDCRGPLVVLIGSERDGLSAQVRAAADVVARLPMRGRASSLNVSAATAAIVYEILRQRMVS